MAGTKLLLGEDIAFVLHCGSECMAVFVSTLCLQALIAVTNVLQGCVGKQLAWLEMISLMACWFKTFTFSRQQGTDPMCCHAQY